MTPQLVLLAGGKGKRMGGNKPFAPYGRSTLIETLIARLKPQVRGLVINAGAKESPLILPLSCLGLPLIFGEISRAMMSTGPPGGKATTMRRGLLG